MKIGYFTWIILFVSFSGVAIAEENLIKGDRFTVRVGSYNILDDETTIGLTSGTLVGVSLSTTRDLGMEGRNNALYIDGYYRFNPYHGLVYSWYRNKREGQAIVDEEFEWGGKIYPVNANLVSEYTTSTYKVSYLFSFHHDSQVELGLLAGLHISGMEVAVVGTLNNAVVANEGTSFTAPLPVVGFKMGYDIIPNKLSWTNQIEFFYINIGDYQGGVTDVSSNIEWRFSKFVGIGAAYKSTRLSLEAQVDRKAANFLDTNSGITTYFSFYF